MGICVVIGGYLIELLDEEFELIVKNFGIFYINLFVVEVLIWKIFIIIEVELVG